ncbi:MAG: InlB B-repeat-containing protein [Treponema porcinum]|uniref:InlB B-repeat-containing protein n=1 Tax=Treponema porcinum TaxID=261392 RepID=UPI002A7F90EB|nr:InlB B-repeat-containing protein [Treponema porcinum]MDY5121830.1 InlB B-repeat-containing protein [Treponema porcinum]
MKKRILFLSVLTLFLSSCGIFSPLSENTGAISIKMPEGSERIAETYDVNEITSFTAELYDSGSSPVTKVSSTPGKSITFESLTPGSYAIVIKAFISAECAAYAEKSGIVVEAGATTYETITLFKNIIKNIESVEIAKESLDKITKNYTVGQTFALPDNVSIIAHFIHGYEKELEPNDYEIYICNAEKYTEETLVENQPLSENSRFAVIGICTESGYKYSAPVSLLMNAEEPVVSWTIPTVKDNTISFTISASASGEISYTWEKAKTADMAGKTACTSEIEIASDGTVSLPLKDASGNYIYYLCTVTNKNIVVNGATTASRQTDVFGGELESFTAKYTGKYGTPGQLDNITAFEITETYADGYVLNIQSLPVNYKLAYAENLSNPEQLVGNIPLVITNLAAFDADGKNLTYEVTVPFKYSFAEDDLAFEITADGGKQENETITIAQYSGIITLSASNSLPAYMLYDGENNASTAIENTVSYAWYNSSSETIDSKIGNLENDATYYCEQTITSSEPEWYVSSEPVKKSIEIKTEPWIIEVRKSEDDGTVEGSLDAGEYTLYGTNSCASENETIVYSINPEGIVTLDENNGFTVNQQSNEVTIKISLSIDGKVVATKEYTIPKQGTYIVTFETNGGSAVASQTIVDNGTATTPTAPTKTGYTFAGWYTDIEYTDKYDFSKKVTEDITLYAKWIEVITNWSALSAKLEGATGDVGDIYISGDFDVTTQITFSGTANIISTGTGVTFSRNEGCKDDFFYLNPDSLTFKGSESAPIVFDGKNIEASLITNWGTTTFEYCSFQNNYSSSYASVYLSYKLDTSKTTFKSCTFTGNIGPKGGAVYIADSTTVTFSDCRFENNTSSSDGGAVYIEASATGTFSDCIFGNAEYENLGNSCTGSYGGGGAVYATGASITLSNCEFYYNKATGDYGNGGAIGADTSSTVTITKGCTFKYNETALVEGSSTHGGALYINKSSLVLPKSGNIFVNNREGNKTEYILSDIYIVPGTINDSDSYSKGSYTVAEDGTLTSTSTSE